MEALRWFDRRLQIEANTGLEVVLRQDRPLRLVRARGRRLLCTGGCAWITVPGVPDDIFLKDGQAWEVAGDGLVLVEAVGRAMVSIATENRANLLLA